MVVNCYNVIKTSINCINIFVVVKFSFNYSEKNILPIGNFYCLNKYFFGIYE